MRVAVAMSGGVDSLRTAALLREQGNDVFAIHMRLLPQSGWHEDREEDQILRRRELNLRHLTSILDIPLVIIDMQDVFKNEVIIPFIDAYRNGLTPNPCVVCNPTVKFGFLMQEAKTLGASHLATGHYVIKRPKTYGLHRHQLFRAKDLSKDQSYFLYGLTQQQLCSAIFPLGDLTKNEVVQWAQQRGFASMLPAESQELCFVLSGTYQEFLLRTVSENPVANRGPIVDMEGNYLAQHKGMFSYTIGQRRGLGIASTEPYYVIDLEPSTNTIRVGREQDLYSSEFEVGSVNWLSIEAPTEPLQAYVRIRNQHKPSPAVLVPKNKGSRVIIRSENPQRAVTPGQAAVFYLGDLVLGGGTILKRPRK